MAACHNRRDRASGETLSKRNSALPEAVSTKASPIDPNGGNREDEPASKANAVSQNDLTNEGAGDESPRLVDSSPLPSNLHGILDEDRFVWIPEL